ncbi:uncharacterized protein LOC132282098 [Cornus florida]|uniref:uncharacterized protein LOC132282098 n=1 Tax=Cornus florida TaxID=4283 RepID=UPI002896D43B|nr:uncharacterized protein LOC132282098 [Cornus florida]
MDMEPWMIEIPRKLEVEYKDKLETVYGVEIHTDAILLACNIITFKYSDGLDTNVEEKALDFDECSLLRTFVECDEYYREKDPAKKLWFPHVKRDYEDLMNKWDGFMWKWKPTVLSQKSSKEERAEETCMLEQPHQMLVSCLEEMEVANVMDSTLLFGVGQRLGTVVTKLMLTIDENFKQNLTVTPCLIAKVASLLTGIPASCLLHFSEPPLQGLETRLAKGLIGQEHVPFVISNALSRPRVDISFFRWLWAGMDGDRQCSC